MERNNDIYEGDPTIEEIEKRLGNVLKYLEKGQIKKAEGGVKGVWHTLIQLAENIHSYIDNANRYASIAQDEVEKDSYYFSPYTAKTSVEEVRSSLCSIEPLLKTKARTMLEKKFDDDKLEKGWKYACDKVRQEYAGRCIRGMHFNSESEKEERIARCCPRLPDLPITAKMVNHSGYIYLNVPLISRPMAEEWWALTNGGRLGELTKYINEYFGVKFDIREDLQYGNY